MSVCECLCTGNRMLINSMLDCRTILAFLVIFRRTEIWQDLIRFPNRRNITTLLSFRRCWALRPGLPIYLNISCKSASQNTLIIYFLINFCIILAASLLSSDNFLAYNDPIAFVNRSRSQFHMNIVVYT